MKKKVSRLGEKTKGVSTINKTIYNIIIPFQLITAKLVNVGSSMPSSPDSNADSSGGAPHHTFDGPNMETEKHLPGVVSSTVPFWLMSLRKLAHAIYRDFFQY